MYCKGDFHMHTNASDGKYSPRELINLAKEKGIDILAITDHDTTDNLDDAIEAGLDLNVKIIPGIELSTLHNKESIHILGYFKDDSFKNKNFQDFLKDMKEYRIWRAKKIIDNLYMFFKIKIDYETILKNSNGVIARPHIAKAIMESGYNYTFDFIFRNILNDKSPAYVPNKKVSIEEGIKLLKSVNATVVLAHPVLIKNTSLEEIIKFDFDGLEAIYPANTEKDTNRLIDMAKKYNKIITAGSDFHTGDEGDTKHGRLGDIYLDEEGIQKFLNILNN